MGAGNSPDFREIAANLQEINKEKPANWSGAG
jgi:hypothetical protein